MAVQQYAGMEIAGPVGTIGEVREFLAAVEQYGATDDTIVDGYLGYRATGIPTPADGGATIVFLEEGPPRDEMPVEETAP